jgi:tRNA(Ile)-lysidine synthase
MALLLLFKELLDSNNLGEQLIALTVDHNLSCSKEYISTVQSWISQHQIRHEILEWHHAPLQAAVEEKARAARYELLTTYCINNRIPRLFVAHHAQDQAETMLMHMMRCSGLRGLGGMRPRSTYNGVEIVRPLLGVHPQELKDVLSRFKQPYMTDPDNLLEQFERVRWRRMIEQNSDINVCNMAQSARFLQQIEMQIEASARAFLNENLLESSFPRKAFFELMPIVAQTVLKLLVYSVTKKKQLCSFGACENAYRRLSNADFVAMTVSGCLIRRVKSGRIAVTQEKQRKQRLSEGERGFTETTLPNQRRMQQVQ